MAGITQRGVAAQTHRRQLPIFEERRPCENKKSAAAALGRLGGLKGGKARAKVLSAKRRKEIAQKLLLPDGIKNKVRKFISSACQYPQSVYNSKLLQQYVPNTFL